MDSTTGQVLVSALAVSMSPLPVGAALVMLLAGDRRSTSLGFLGGWLTGIALVLAGAGGVGRVVGVGRGGSSPVLSTLALAVGVLAFVVAVRTWRRRRVWGAGSDLPRWMAAVSSLPPTRAVVMGLLLVGANPKALVLILPAGIALAGSGVSAGEELGAGALFVLLAGSTVLVPVALRQAVGQRADPALVTMREFLTRHGTRISVVLLLVVGAAMAVQGASGLVAAVIPAG